MSKPEEFNEPQKRRLLSSASYIDKLLIEIEQILSASSSPGFPKYKNSMSPVQVRVARDYIKRLRQQIIRVLTDLDIVLPEARIDSTHGIRVTLQFVEVALEEIAPERLVGYGDVPESLVRSLAGGIQEMKGIVRQMDSYVSQRAEADLSSRLLRLPQADAGLIKQLGAIIERHSLIEFRAPLSHLVEKIQSPTYEIAFFGRVSSGKSSLLNRIIGTDLLPTGVTPITAVPTRVKNGPVSKLLVWTADGRFVTYGVDRLADFVTEKKNPANEKRVTRLLVEIPLPVLPEEVVLVDTPGLGSLALEGAAETLAYLPRCDLGVVLVDASSNLHTDDVATVDALRAASAPSLVVLSKVDLVPEGDRPELLEYTRRELAHQLGSKVDVAPLSSRPELSALLQEWVALQIAPRVADARHLSHESNQRKSRTLAQRILHALEVLARSANAPAPDGLPEDLKKAENQLRDAASLIESTREKSFEATDRIRVAREPALDRLTDAAITSWQQEFSSVQLDDAWIAKHVNQLAQAEAERLASLLQNTASELTAALNTAAGVLSTGEREDRFNLWTLVKDMRAAEFPPAAVGLRKPRSLSISAGLARRSIRGDLKTRIGTALEEFFNSYGRALEMWARGAIDRLAREFESQADVYRAQLQRLSSNEPSQGSSSAEVILQDLSSLRHALQLDELEQVGQEIESGAT